MASVTCFSVGGVQVRLFVYNNKTQICIRYPSLEWIQVTLNEGPLTAQEAIEIIKEFINNPQNAMLLQNL